MITLSSDFRWPYPAAMRGVICQRSDARIVDVTHQFPRQDVRAAAFWLREVLPYFPPAVHVAVVDPGVGTDRGVLAIRAGEHVLVGPDNGLLLPVARRLAAAGDDRPGGSSAVEAFAVGYEDPESVTFHGRDVFAPLGAEIHETGRADFHRGERFSATDEYVDLTFPAASVGDDEIAGEILVVDDFGNAITNVPGAVLDGEHSGDLTVEIGGRRERAPVARTYAAVAAGQRLFTVGSHGNVELAVNRGRGDDSFGVEAGDGIRIVR
jgi:S-adenosylmethionine hydrolase